jgi:hypothetical protein
VNRKSYRETTGRERRAVWERAGKLEGVWECHHYDGRELGAKVAGAGDSTIRRIGSPEGPNYNKLEIRGRDTSDNREHESELTVSDSLRTAERVLNYVGTHESAMQVLVISKDLKIIQVKPTERETGYGAHALQWKKPLPPS